MQLHETKIIANSPLRGGYRTLMLDAHDAAAIALPGQFVHLRIPNIEPSALRRPFSICDASDGVLTFLYKEVGRGTGAMGKLAPGDPVNILGPLGNSFPAPKSGAVPLLVAGGYGVAPLLFFARRRREKGVLFVGGRSAQDILLVDDFRAIGWETQVCTDDGSQGTKGFVTAALDAWRSAHPTTHAEMYACGPNPMLAAVDARAGKWGIQAWLSLDRNMGCAVGACLGCVQKVKGVDPSGKEGPVFARVCKDGPIFGSGTIIWGD